MKELMYWSITEAVGHGGKLNTFSFSDKEERTKYTKWIIILKSSVPYGDLTSQLADEFLKMFFIKGVLLSMGTMTITCAHVSVREIEIWGACRVSRDLVESGNNDFFKPPIFHVLRKSVPLERSSLFAAYHPREEYMNLNESTWTADGTEWKVGDSVQRLVVGKKRLICDAITFLSVLISPRGKQLDIDMIRLANRCKVNVGGT